MVYRIYRFLVGLFQTTRNRAFAFDDWDKLARWDVAYDEELTVLDSERLQTSEEGEVVGTTAVLHQRKLILSAGKLLARCDETSSLEIRLTCRVPPIIERDEAAILTAGKCTSFLFIEETTPSGRYTYRFCGTAFFISDRLLLTAGHNVVGVNGPVSEILITYPGLCQVDSWQVAERSTPTIKCKILETIYSLNGDFSKDIAILDAGSFSARNHLSLSSTIPPQNATVDVVGYPGDIIDEWLEAHETFPNIRKAKEEADRLLKKGSLTVTRGTIKTIGTNITYYISTCPGMGGACVLYNGSVIGE